MIRRQVIVTKGDIAKGEPMATSPLVSAIERVVKSGTWFWVRHDCVVFRVGAGRERRATFDAVTSNWVRTFDRDGVGQPFSFDLLVPDEVLAPRPVGAFVPLAVAACLLLPGCAPDPFPNSNPVANPPNAGEPGPTTRK